MKNDIALLEKVLCNNDRIFIEVDAENVDIDYLLKKALILLKNDVDNSILYTKLSVLIKLKSTRDKTSIKNIVKTLNCEYEYIKITEELIGRYYRFNDRMLKIFKEDRKLFDAYKSLITRLGYKTGTVEYSISALEKDGLVKDLGYDKIVDIINNFEKDSDTTIFNKMLSKSSVTKQCSECGNTRHISQFRVGNRLCRECYNLKEIRRERGDDGVKAYLTRKCTQDTEKNIKEFKEVSKESHEKSAIIHSRNYLDIKSQLESLSEFIDTLYYTDASGMSFEESLDINIKCVELNKKLLETEEKIYAEQLSSTEQPT